MYVTYLDNTLVQIWMFDFLSNILLPNNIENSSFLQYFFLLFILIKKTFHYAKFMITVLTENRIWDLKSRQKFFFILTRNRIRLEKFQSLFVPVKVICTYTVKFKRIITFSKIKIHTLVCNNNLSHCNFSIL